MSIDDGLRNLLLEFFELPTTTPPSDLTQLSIGNWDSLAMVQLITEIQSSFEIEFDLDEIEQLTTYEKIRDILTGKGVSLPIE